MKRLFALSLLLLAAALSPYAADYPPSKWFPGMFHPPAVTVALPAHFIITSAVRDPSIDGEWGMYDGVFWAPPKTAKRYAHMAHTNLREITEPLFFVHLSDNVGQQPGTDTFNVEASIDEMVAATGVKEARTEKLKWGDYPVFVFTGKRPDGSPIYIAWIGINSPDGWAILVDYRVPPGKGHPTAAETAIWDKFLHETKPSN